MGDYMEMDIDMFWMYGKNRHRHQRALNKRFRELNNHVIDRYAVIQDATYFFEYDRDHWQKQQFPAEYFMVVDYHFVDKETGRESRSYRDSANHLKTCNLLWKQMSDFINEGEMNITWGNALPYAEVKEGTK